VVLGFLSVATLALVGGTSPAVAGPVGPTVVAMPDDLHRLVPDETATTSVLANDTVDGVPAMPGNATVTPGEAPDPGLALGGDGLLHVGSTVQPGSYTYAYTVCAEANPTVCATSAAVFSIGAVVTFDPDFGVSGAPGGTTPSVLGGVRLNGLVASADTVTARPGEAPDNGLRMRIDGTITIDPGTPAGTYAYPFIACANVEPFGCPNGAASVAVTAASPGVDPDGELPRTGSRNGGPLASAITLIGLGTLLLTARDRHLARPQPAPRHRRC
jgi:hypothetical protein